MRNVSVGTAVQLASIFWPEFVELNGCVFLARKVPKESGALGADFDHTGAEALHNHTHMIDIVNHKALREPSDENDSYYDAQHPDFLLMCRLAKTVAKMWFEKLQTDFPNYEFRVYYTELDNPIVRFHRVREDESNWLEESDWPGDIERGTVVVYDTRHPSPK